MDRPPRRRSEGVIRGATLAMAWGFLGAIAAVLVIGGFLLVLHQAGWQPGDTTGAVAPLRLAYQRATTVAWLGIVACHIGIPFAARTERASLRSVGLFTNRPLLCGILVAVGFAMLLV
jgi:magnesium-transporting ATPase (P-type)